MCSTIAESESVLDLLFLVFQEMMGILYILRVRIA